MKIKDTRIGTVRFERLCVGDVFEYEENVFLKIKTVCLPEYEEEHDFINAINLSENEPCEFYEGDLVKLLNAELVVS